MLKQLESNDSGATHIDKLRQRRVDRACEALGRLGKANREQREAVLAEFFEAHEDLARPLNYKPPKEARRVNLPQRVELGLLQWFVDLGNLPDRTIERHAAENGLGVSPDVCIEIWRRKMPERFQMESRRRAKLDR